MSHRLFFFSAGVCLAGFFLTCSIVDQRSHKIPSVNFRLLDKDQAQDTQIQASDGSDTDMFSDRSFLYTHDIPPLVSSAFIAAEDRRFLSHKGIDLMAILRAGLGNVGRHHQEGASTITQQVVKMLITGDEKSYQRKIDEAILATRMEQSLSKQDIMRLYLNSIYFGKGAYGIGAAARIWFNKDVTALSISDVAFLAALPKGPRLIDPAIHPDRALARRLYVLQNMQKIGAITKDQVASAQLNPLPIPAPALHSGAGRSYYTEYVRRLLSREGVDVYHAGAVYKTWQVPAIQTLADNALREALIAYDIRHGWRSNDNAGTEDNEAPADWLRITIQSCRSDPATHTSTCTALAPDGRTITLSNTYTGTPPNPGQKAYAVNGLLRQIPGANGALLVMDYSGHVVAQSGGFWRGNTSFDRVLSMRQTGSTIKPFIACAAIDKGWTPETIIADVPITLNNWSPGGDGHDEGAGFIPLMTALSLSRNQGFVRLGMEVGFPDVYLTLRSFGLYDQNTTLSPSSVLGATETSLLRLTTAYAQIASGRHVMPSWLQKQDEGTISDGKVSCAKDVRRMLSDVVSEGTARSAFSGIEGVSGKTGTSNQVMDGWFVGYDAHYVVGVYIGYDRPQPLGDKEFGATLAAPAAASVFRGLHALSK